MPILHPDSPAFTADTGAEKAVWDALVAGLPDNAHLIHGQRITADGQMRTCLFSRTETDLRTPLRAGAPDEEIAELWAGAQGRKAAAHGIGEAGFVQPARTMSAIGG